MSNMIRVGVAAAVGFLVALLAKQGFHLSPVVTATVTTVVTGLVAGLYHTAVVRLEKTWPWLSVLLGSKPAAPAKRAPKGGTV